MVGACASRPDKYFPWFRSILNDIRLNIVQQNENIRIFVREPGPFLIYLMGASM